MLRQGLSSLSRTARVAVRPRNIAMGVTFMGGAVVAQTAYVLGTYSPLPRPIQERVQGVERWIESKDWVPARVKSILKRISEAGDAFVTRSDDVAKGTSTGGGGINRPKRVIIIGDSLVVGIGCKEAPVMPIALCRQLASLLKVDVQWRALGVDGGDVRTIHSNVLSLVDDFQREGNGASIDAVILLCGLNDFKKLWMGRTSSVFRRDLDSFMYELRSKVGDECQIILPAIPMEETKLPEPLKTFSIALGALFDEEKQNKAAGEALTHFIPKPCNEYWLKAKEGGRVSIVAEDGVHPNEIGYDVFGAYVAEETAKILAERVMSVQAAGDVLSVRC